MKPDRATRLLYRGVIAPLAVLARPFWRRRLGLEFDPQARTYWHDRGRHRIGARDLTTQR
jgi:hypothetical protein